MPQTYTVAYTIAAFTGSNGTAPAMAATGVTVAAINPSNGNNVIKLGTAGVQVAGPASMAITLSDGSSNVFTPIGLALQGVPSGGGIPGKGNSSLFPATSINSNVITLTDNSPAKGPPPNTTTNYEFVVLFQDSNGYFLVLDPLISNIQ